MQEAEAKVCVLPSTKACTCASCVCLCSWRASDKTHHKQLQHLGEERQEDKVSYPDIVHDILWCGLLIVGKKTWNKSLDIQRRPPQPAAMHAAHPPCSCLAVADDGDHGVYTAVYPCRKGFHFRTLGLRATEHLLREQRSFSDPPSVVKCTAGTRGGQSKLCDPVTVVPRESIPTNSKNFHKMFDRL